MSPRASLCVSLVSLTWAAWRTTLPVSHRPLQRLLYFFYPLVLQRRHTRSLLNVNTFRAGQEGDRETDEGLLKGPVCVCCVCVLCLSAGLWVGSLTTSRIPPSATCSPGTCQPDVEPLYWQPQIPPPQHGDPHSRNASPTFTSHNRAAL